MLVNVIASDGLKVGLIFLINFQLGQLLHFILERIDRRPPLSELLHLIYWVDKCQKSIIWC